MADSTSAHRDSLIEAVKRSRPAALNVVLLDGSEKRVAIPGKRKKWSQVSSVLDSLAWIRLECLNAKGDVLDIIENDEAADDMEDLNGFGGSVHQLTALMLKAQDVALRRQSEAHRSTMEMNLELCRLMMDRLTALEKGFAANLKMAQRFAQAAADADGDDELMSSAAIDALMPLLIPRLLPQKPVPAKAPPKGGKSAE